MTVPLILASKSTARRALLENAGIPFRWMDAAVDEGTLKRDAASASVGVEETALTLAETKALTVSETEPDALVLGCDQVLALDDRLFDKPTTMADARNHLLTLRGRSHRLISAAVLVREGTVVWRLTDIATLTMRDVSDTYIERYLENEGDAVLSSVGAYRLESLGVQLFRSIEGSYFTILGLPLLPLLEELRNRGIVPR